jgi:hypothetical protein
MEMKKLMMIAIMLVSMSAHALEVTAFKTGERVTGQTKQCYYKFAGSEYTKTIKSYELCPLSIKVKI